MGVGRGAVGLRRARATGFAIVMLCSAAGWRGGAPSHAAPRAERGAVVEPGPDRGRTDWTRGLLLAVGAAAADIRAPSPVVARAASERLARQRAHAALAERARAMTLADGTRVEAAAADPAVAERLAGAVARALDVDVDYGSEGSVVVTCGLPLEAIRLAVVGAPMAEEAVAAAQPAPTALRVDARGQLARPELGLTLVNGGARYAGPTVFYRDRKAAAADPRLGGRVVALRATARHDGQLEVDGAADSLAAAARAGALVVIVVGEKDGN